jgi:nitrate reductase NapE component
MRITRYDITTFAEVDYFDLSPILGATDPNPFISFGVVADTNSDYAYITDFSVEPLGVLRLVKSTAVADLATGSLGTQPGEFSEPTFATIVIFPVASVDINRSFGHIIW